MRTRRLSQMKSAMLVQQELARRTLHFGTLVDAVIERIRAGKRQQFNLVRALNTRQ
jgi:hypothetical protein